MKIPWWLPYLTTLALFILLRGGSSVWIWRRSNALRDCEENARRDDPNGTWHNGQNPCQDETVEVLKVQRFQDVLHWYWLLVIWFGTFVWQVSSH